MFFDRFAELGAFGKLFHFCDKVINRACLVFELFTTFMQPDFAFRFIGFSRKCRLCHIRQILGSMEKINQLAAGVLLQKAPIIFRTVSDA